MEKKSSRSLLYNLIKCGLQPFGTYISQTVMMRFECSSIIQFGLSTAMLKIKLPRCCCAKLNHYCGVFIADILLC